MTSEEQLRMSANCARVFSPSAPVDRSNLFAGRILQIRKLCEAIGARGRHAIMYGDRGVGKTSLANILKDLYNDQQGMKIVRINCGEGDTFRSVWLKALAEITVTTEALQSEPGPTQAVTYTLDAFANEVENLGPGELRRLLQRWSQEEFELIVVFDEFDRLPEHERVHFADTLKDLSDHSVFTTVVLVGVARDVNDLFEEHASVERCLEQIHMPLMSRAELREIITKAMVALKMTIDDEAAELIVSLSQGFPHYTHLIGQQSASKAIWEGQLHITLAHVEGGIAEAISKSQQTIVTAYHRAAHGQRKGTLFPQVLLACALAEVDELGAFSSADVREPLCAIAGKDYDIPNFSQHLDKFSSDASRGPILEKSGTSRRFRFKFLNPLLKPFIIMKGLNEGTITGSLLKRLRNQS